MYIATILFIVLHVLLGVSGLQQIDVLIAFKQLCPYTSFCNKNATRFLQGSRQVPCCKECSCVDDCWKRNNCCLDKIGIGEEWTSEVETCKDTYVKRGAARLNRNR